VNSKIYISKTEDREKFVEKILEIYRDVIEGANSVFIKPNLVSHETYPTTTHPKALSRLIELLVSMGKKVVVGDAPAVDLLRSDRIVRDHPLQHVCMEHGLRLLNLYKHGMRKFVSDRGYSFKASAIPLECDLIISLPVLKAHYLCRITGALKNQFGFLSRLDRILMHSKVKDINRGIAELNVIFKPGITIVDAVETYIHAQELRHGGIRKHLGYMLAGSDPVALDCKGLELLSKVSEELTGIKPESIKHIYYSIMYGVGTLDYKEEKL